MILYKNKIVGTSTLANGNVFSDDIHNIKVLTRAEYIALDEKQSDTLYLIQG